MAAQQKKGAGEDQSLIKKTVLLLETMNIGQLLPPPLSSLQEAIPKLPPHQVRKYKYINSDTLHLDLLVDIESSFSVRGIFSVRVHITYLKKNGESKIPSSAKVNVWCEFIDKSELFMVAL